MEINSIKDFKSNFAKIYHSSVVPSLQAFEADRTRTFKCAVLYTILGLAVCISTLIYCLKVDNSFIGSIAFIGIIISCIIYACMQKNFENRLKTRVMPVLMQAFGKFTWTTAPVIDTEFIKASKIFNYFENRSVDDNFTGIYRGMPIDISETELTYKTRDSKGRTQTHTTFKGVIISIGAGKNFTGHTIVRCRGLLGNRKVYEEVKLEDPEFSKQFFVDANDQVEARFLLTTAFMERFKKISNSYPLFIISPKLSL